MSSARQVLLIITLIGSTPCAAWAESAGQPLHLASRPSATTQPSDWIFQSAGPYEGWADPRDLFVIRHPFSGSRTGSFGAVSREVQIPKPWKSPVRLHFYMTDDYFGQVPDLDKGSWLSQVKLIGHRYKQVLVDDVVVWEQDVADVQEPSEPSRYSVPLLEKVKPGDRVRVTFRLIDKVGSNERLHGDYRCLGQLGGMKETDDWEFMTNMYVGDVHLTPADARAPPPGPRPNEKRVRQMHEKCWPLPPDGQPVRFPVALTWECAEPMTGSTCAIRCGLPMPAGRIKSPSQIVLKDKAGRHLPLQAEVLNRWPDSSPRWVAIDTVAVAGDDTRTIQLDILDQPTSSPATDIPVSIVARQDREVVIRSGPLIIRVGGPEGQLVSEITSGGARFTDLTAEVQVADKVYRPVIDKAEVVAGGPVRAEVQLTGVLVAGTEQMGPCVFRLSAFAGQPYVRMTWRIYNHQEQTQTIRRFDLMGGYELDASPTVLWSSKDADPTVRSATGPVSLRQLTNDKFEVLDSQGKVADSGGISSGWLGVEDGKRTLMVSVRHFREQFPKAIEVRQNQIRIALFASQAGQPTYDLTEGEAKRHEVWLGLWDRPVPEAGLAAYAAYFDRPARLFNADYACASGAFGQTAPHDENRFPEFHEIVAKTYGDISAPQFYVNGIRNWGDYPYSQTWCNGYYNVQMGLAAEYIMTDDPRWFDHLEATVRHIMDVDICHASARHPEWVGSLHCGSCGTDHTSSYPWPAMQKNWGTLALWRLTGDPDVREAALGMADAIIRAGSCMGNCGSVRDHAGVLYCLTGAYDETLDDRYLQAAREVVRDALKHIEHRRGCYIEVHGNASYRGNVPWMGAQLCESLYLYYRQSGDVQAAVALVGLDESILDENRNRDVPGDIFGYSHNPQFGKTASYHVLIAPAILQAYELTGDEEYLVHGRAMYAQMIRERNLNSIRNCYWTAPTLLYHLHRVGQQGTLPLLGSRAADGSP